MNNEVKQYIRGAINSGMSGKEVLEALTSVGWHIRDIGDVILELEREIKSNGEEIISVHNISKSYGKVNALDDISLNVKRGAVTAVLGPNGAGKTTLVRILATLLMPTQGQATVAGLDVVRDAQKVRAIIGLAGQYAAVDEILSGRENLEMVGRLYHLNSSESRGRTNELLKQFELEDAADRPVKTYSGGMRRRLDLAASLVARPQILFLDEPTTGLDPRSRFTLWNIMRDLTESGTTIVLTTQYLEEADQLANQIFVIDHGRIIAEGTADELKHQVGGDVVELHMTNHRDADKAAESIRHFGKEEPQADNETGIVTMPADGGASVLTEIIRKLDTTGLNLSDVILRRASLDDVFLKLTGHKTESN